MSDLIPFRFSFRSARLTLAAVFAALAVLAGVAIAPSAGAAVTATAPPATLTVVGRADGSALVAWTAVPDSTRQRFVLYIADSVSLMNVRFAPASATSMVVDELVPGTTYKFALVAQGTGGTSSSVSQSATIPAGQCAGASGPCVTVDASTRTGAEAHLEQGILHGVTSSTPGPLLAGLSPTSWRIDAYDQARYAAARAAGGTVTMLMSDAWAYDNWSGTHVWKNPWDDWAGYAAFVTSTVQWHQSMNMMPDYWEIQNEPNDPSWYSPATPPSRSLVLEQLAVAYSAIKQAQPDAKIVGPSLGDATVNAPSALLDFQSVMDDAVTRGMRYDAISWHENGYGPAGTYEGGTRALAEHVSWVREALAEHPALGQPPLFVNEYGAAWAQGIPGAEVGYLAALERANVDQGIHSCFPIATGGTPSTADTCFDPRGLLDGLVSLDGRATPAWWVHREYATMRGDRIVADGNDTGLPAYATLGSSGEIDVLVGRDQGCDTAIDSWCPAGTPLAPAMTPQLHLKLPLNVFTRQYAVTITRVPHQGGALDTPITVVSGGTLKGRSTLSLTLPTLASGDAVFVQIVPQ